VPGAMIIIEMITSIIQYELDFQISLLTHENTLFHSKDWHQHIYKPFLEPKIVKMQCQNAKTEPETIIFLEAQGELAAPLFFMYLIGLAAIFKI
jgi:hypothetical protein